MKKGIKMLLLQAAVGFAAAVAAFILKPLPIPYGICAWGALPLIGLCSAYRVTRCGVNPYLSWILPPLTLTLGALTADLFLYLPPGGMMLLTAFASLIGAAAGDVRNKQDHKRKK